MPESVLPNCIKGFNKTAIIIEIIGGNVRISFRFDFEKPTPEMIKPTEFLIIIDVARNILATPSALGEKANIIGKGKFRALENDEVQSSAEDGLSCFLYFAIRWGVTIPIKVTRRPAATGYSQVKPSNSIFTIDVNIKIGVKMFMVNFTNLSLY